MVDMATCGKTPQKTPQKLGFRKLLPGCFHTSGNACGCMVWCSSAFYTCLPYLKSLQLGCNDLSHLIIPPPGFTAPMVGPSCATHLLSCLEKACLDVVPYILSGSIGYTCRHTHVQVENLLEVISPLRIFQLPNFKTGHELALGFWWHIKPHVAYKKLMLQGCFLARDNFHTCDKSAHCSGEKDEDYLRGCIYLLVCDEMAVTFLTFNI